MTLIPLFVRRLLGLLRRKPRRTSIAYADANQKLAAAFTRQYLEGLAKQDHPMIDTINDTGNGKGKQ